MILTDEQKETMLKELNEMHTPDEVPDAGKLPDGTYQGKLDKIYLEQSKKGRNQCVMDFEIVSGSYQGRNQRKYCGMETPDNLDFLTRDLRTLGIPSFIWTEVEKYFPKLLDTVIEFDLVTKDGYQNVYLQKRIGVFEPAKPQGIEPMFGRSVPDDEDIPF